MNRVRRRLARSLVLAGLAAVRLGAGAPAQGRGDYFNVESPQVAPIALANVSGRTLLVVCNTPDNTVEIWDTAEPLAAQPLDRVQVGLEPVSVLVAGNR